MTRLFCLAAFVLGLLAIAWVGAGYVASNPLALTMTLLIGTVYLVGALELRQVYQATTTLARALDAMPAALSSLDSWLATVPPPLQHPVRLRIEGQRVALPGPAMAPYLVGLLVLLGMLGTFLGMVVTLNGAVMALESTTDLPTIRAALAAPVRGLGLAFGTSVAGVAASAMLGLVSALCRRHRLQVAQRLDSRIASTLRGLSLAHQRQESRRAAHREILDALQLQARVLPEVVTPLAAELTTRLQTLMTRMDHQHQALHARLLAGQDSFHAEATTAYAALAVSVGQSLTDSLSATARLAGATIEPVVQATMAAISRETTLLHGTLASTVQSQLDGMSARLARADEQRQAAFAESLQAMARSLQQDWQHTSAAATLQQAQICKTLEQTASSIQLQAQAHAQQTLAEVAGLVHAAAAAPRAAAEMALLLRQQLSDSLARDNGLLDERSRIMAALGQALQAVQQGSTAQQGAVHSLVASAAALLQQVSARFTATIETESAKLASIAAHVTGSAVEVASLGESFGAAVQLFSASNEGLVASLQRIENALSKSTTRSDEQLAYYVAQARDIIDLSLLSQQQIVEDLQRLASGTAQPAAPAVALA